MRLGGDVGSGKVASPELPLRTKDTWIQDESYKLPRGGRVMPGKHRKHTPIVSQAQQGMMGAELARRRKGQKPQMKGMKTGELESHLHESKGKKLPEYSDHAKPL